MYCALLTVLFVPPFLFQIRTPCNARRVVLVHIESPKVEKAAYGTLPAFFTCQRDVRSPGTSMKYGNGDFLSILYVDRLQDRREHYRNFTVDVEIKC